MTNIPIDETIEIICNKLYFTDPKLKSFIPEHFFRQLLNFATKFTHFQIQLQQQHENLVQPKSNENRNINISKYDI